MVRHTQIDFNLPGLARRESPRPRRVAEAVRRELAVLLLQRVQDPRLHHVNICRVEMSPDLRVAKVYYALPPETDGRMVRQGLERAKGFFRHQVADRLGLRYAPELVFKVDNSLDDAARMDELLREIGGDEA